MNYEGIKYIRILPIVPKYFLSKSIIYYIGRRKTSITCIDNFILLQSLCILYT